MFVLLSFLKILFIPVTFLLIGMTFLPPDTLYLVGGVVTGVVGLVVLFFSFKAGLIMIAIGVVMVAISVWIRKKIERESIAAAEAATETARRASMVMGLYIPPDK